jgi:hypothetical protein
MPAYTEHEAREAIGASESYTGALRALGLCASGNNAKVLRRWVERWGISTRHFDPWAASRRALRREPIPLAEVLVEGSTYSRNKLKLRLYEAGLKRPVCELCGQGEIWRGQRMALILDHVNGVPDDNRLANLRIACPNCAATFDTHCARKNRHPIERRQCLHCGAEFVPKYGRHRYCSRACGMRARGPSMRRVERPPYEQLVREISETSVVAVGRKYGVSDNAIRKWLRQYERERAAAEAQRAA